MEIQMGRQGSGAAALFDQVLREVQGHVLSQLCEDDKASFGAASWSTLEAVLRDRDATLRVDPAGSVLAALAVRPTAAQLQGTIECRGVGVPARQAGELMKALRFVETPPPDTEPWLHVAMGWWQYVHGVVEAASLMVGAGALQVTRLVLPPVEDDPSGFKAMELMSLQHVLASPAVHDSLRCLHFRPTDGTWKSWSLGELAPVLHGLPALEHLIFGGDECHSNLAGRVLGRPIGEVLEGCTRLRRLDMYGTRLSREGTVAFMKWLPSATALRHLTLDGCHFDTESHIAEMLDESWSGEEDSNTCSLPPHLEVFVVEFSLMFNVDGWSRLTHLRTLVMESEQCALDALQVAAVLRRNRALRRLVLGGFDGTFDCASTCALLDAAACCPLLEIVDLGVSAAGGTAEERTSALTTLLRTSERIREVAFDGGHGFDDGECFDLVEVAAALRENKSLRKLALRGCGVGEEGAAALGGVLAETDLASLAICQWGSFDEGSEAGPRSVAVAATLARCLARCKTLRELDLSGHPFGDEGAAVLAAVLPRLSLRKLVLRCTRVGCDGARSLAEVLRRTALEELVLRGNCIGDDGAAALAAAIRDGATVASLDLGCNKITGEGARALSEALLANVAVARLDLGYNKIQLASQVEIAAKHGTDRVFL